MLVRIVYSTFCSLTTHVGRAAAGTVRITQSIEYFKVDYLEEAMAKAFNPNCIATRTETGLNIVNTFHQLATKPFRLKGLDLDGST